MDFVNTKNWKEFKIGEIFDVSLGFPIHKNTIKNISPEFFENSINYITRTSFNNGLGYYVDLNEIDFNKIEKGNCITIGAEGFKPFFQKKDFITGNKISILRNKKLNSFNSFFIIGLINLVIKNKYSFGRGLVSSRIKEITVKLPINKENKPDFEFMENYIKNISKKINYTQNLELKKTNLLNKSNWKEFKVGKVFDVKKGERLIKTQRIKGKIPLITASSKKNGIVEFLNFETYKDKKKLFSNVISIDMFFNVFYQKESFFADDNVHTLKIKENIPLNKYNSIFLISCFKKIKKKYDFGRQVRLKRLLNEIIKLPINKEDKPDFEFMENYIKSLPYSANL